MFQYFITSAENFPVYGGQLGMDGTGVTSFSAHGGGEVYVTWVGGEPGRPGSLFEIVQNADGTVNIGSVDFPGVFLRMDGTGVTSFSADGGGTVNCQFGAGPWETFTLRSDGANVYIESVAFPNVCLRMQVGETGIEYRANCQYGVGDVWSPVVIGPANSETDGVVPDLINLSPAQALAVTQADGWLYAATYADEGTFDLRVVDQFPAAGDHQWLGSLVGVTIAEPFSGTVPDVLNLNPGAARAKIEAAGFAYSGAADPVEGNFKPYVEDQDPGGGTTAPVGSTVDVTIAVPVKGRPE